MAFTSRWEYVYVCCLHTCVVALFILVAFVFMVNRFFLALSISETFFNELRVVFSCILRLVFQKYWEWHCCCMARCEERAENYERRLTCRFPSVCNHCDCLQLWAVSQIMSHSVFSVEFFMLFYDKTCLWNTFSIFLHVHFHCMCKRHA